jgi:lipopolysaccharide biosynthesis glycosyltransferase
MKKRTLVTGGTAKDAAAMGVFVINVKQTNPDLVDEIVIFHDGIKPKDQKVMNSIFPCRFIYYQFPGYDPKDFNDYVNKYFSPMVFCKYECFRLLSEYKVIIWSDYDVVILKDISELLIPGQYEAKMFFDKRPCKINFLDSIVNIIDAKYDLTYPVFGGGLFVLYDVLQDYDSYYNWLIKKTKELGKHLYLAEQGPINLLLQEFSLKVETMDNKDAIYACHPTYNHITEQTKILHAYGQYKFWNGLKNEIWEKNYKIYTKYGGSKLKDRIFYSALKYKIRNFLKTVNVCKCNF